MGLKVIGRREIDQLNQCPCCPGPLSSSLCGPIRTPRLTRAHRPSPEPSAQPSAQPPSAQPSAQPSTQPSAQPSNYTAANPISSSSAAGPDGYGIINLDDLKKEVEKRCACKECVLKTYNKIHTDFLLYANNKQKKNIQECLDIRGTRCNNYEKVVEFLESGKFDLNSYWVSYVRDRARQGLKT